MKENTERLTIWIDPRIKYHAKVKALTHRESLSVVIETLLYDYLGMSERDFAKLKNKDGRNQNLAR